MLVLFFEFFINAQTSIKLYIQDGTRKTGTPSGRPTWAKVSDSV